MTEEDKKKLHLLFFEKLDWKISLSNWAKNWIKYGTDQYDELETISNKTK